MYERSPAFAQRDDVVLPANGKQLAIAPDVRPARKKRLPRHEFGDAFEVVPHQERLAALGADVMQAPRFILLMAGGALEIFDVHSVSLRGKEWAGRCVRCSFTKSYTHIQPFAARMSISTHQLLYGLRLIGALLIATMVPLFIDRRARRSDRTRS